MAYDASRPLGPATRAIHHGYDPAKNDYALTPPVHLTSTFAFPDAETGGALFAGEAEGHIYPASRTRPSPCWKTASPASKAPKRASPLPAAWARSAPSCGHC